MPPTQIGPYRIVKPLGEGGMGVVYEAIQEPIQRRVALKVLLPQHAQNADVLERFFNEARAVNLIEHPGLVQISDYGRATDGTAYLVMELLRGETLSARLDRRRNASQTMPTGEALQIAVQIADALGAAHEKAIVHRDLKPSNVMLVLDSVAPGGERAKVLDFGIAKLAPGQAKGTATHAVMGTPQYMSPEQCRGAGGVDAKTDVYSLGVLLYEMLAGRPPFVAETPLEYMAQHAFVEPPPLQSFASMVPADVAAFVHHLLDKDKARRLPMREASAELAFLLQRHSRKVLDARPSLEESRDETQRYVSPTSPPSTIGSSHGQTLRQLVVGGTWIRQAMAASIAAAILVGAFGYRRSMRDRDSRPGSTAPTLAQRPSAQFTPLTIPNPDNLASSSLPSPSVSMKAHEPQRNALSRATNSAISTQPVRPIALEGGAAVASEIRSVLKPGELQQRPVVKPAAETLSKRPSQQSPFPAYIKPLLSTPTGVPLKSKRPEEGVSPTPSTQPSQAQGHQETVHAPSRPPRPILRDLLEK